MSLSRIGNNYNNYHQSGNYHLTAKPTSSRYSATSNNNSGRHSATSVLNNGRLSSSGSAEDVALNYQFMSPGAYDMESSPSNNCWKEKEDNNNDDVFHPSIEKGLRNLRIPSAETIQSRGSSPECWDNRRSRHNSTSSDIDLISTIVEVKKTHRLEAEINVPMTHVPRDNNKDNNYQDISSIAYGSPSYAAASTSHYWEHLINKAEFLRRSSSSSNRDHHQSVCDPRNDFAQHCTEWHAASYFNNENNNNSNPYAITAHQPQRLSSNDSKQRPTSSSRSATTGNWRAVVSETESDYDKGGISSRSSTLTEDTFVDRKTRKRSAADEAQKATPAQPLIISTHHNAHPILSPFSAVDSTNTQESNHSSPQQGPDHGVPPQREPSLLTTTESSSSSTTIEYPQRSQTAHSDADSGIGVPSSASASETSDIPKDAAASTKPPATRKVCTCQLRKKNHHHNGANILPSINNWPIIPNPHYYAAYHQRQLQSYYHAMPMYAAAAAAGATAATTVDPNGLPQAGTAASATAAAAMPGYSGAYGYPYYYATTYQYHLDGLGNAIYPMIDPTTDVKTANYVAASAGLPNSRASPQPPIYSSTPEEVPQPSSESLAMKPPTYPGSNQAKVAITENSKSKTVTKGLTSLRSRSRSGGRRRETSTPTTKAASSFPTATLSDVPSPIPTLINGCATSGGRRATPSFNFDVTQQEQQHNESSSYFGSRGISGDQKDGHKNKKSNDKSNETYHSVQEKRSIGFSATSKDSEEVGPNHYPWTYNPYGPFPTSSLSSSEGQVPVTEGSTTENKTTGKRMEGPAATAYFSYYPGYGYLPGYYHHPGYQYIYNPSLLAEYANSSTYIYPGSPMVQTVPSTALAPGVNGIHLAAQNANMQISANPAQPSPFLYQPYPVAQNETMAAADAATTRLTQQQKQQQQKQQPIPQRSENKTQMKKMALPSLMDGLKGDESKN